MKDLSRPYGQSVNTTGAYLKGAAVQFISHRNGLRVAKVQDRLIVRDRQVPQIAEQAGRFAAGEESVAFYSYTWAIGAYGGGHATRGGEVAAFLRAVGFLCGDSRCGCAGSLLRGALW